MTIARLWQSGAEVPHVRELTEYTGGLGSTSTQAVSTTKFKTGAYSFRFGTNDFPLGHVLSETQLRAGAFFNHLGLTGTNAIGVFWYIPSTVGVIAVEYHQISSDIVIKVTGSSNVSVSAVTATLNTTNVWRHIGINAYANATTGFISVYVDGVLRLQFTGNTGTAFSGCYVGGRDSLANNGWANYVYVDDFYVDSATGEADVPPPLTRFSFLRANGAGTHTDWSVSGAASNYLAVDDTVPNDLTDYVYASAPAVVDSYALENTVGGVTVPAGYQIDAVILLDWAAKSDAGKATTVKLGSRLSATEVIGAAQALSTTFGPVMERQTTKPGGGAWTESDVDSMEFLHETAGTF